MSKGSVTDYAGDELFEGDLIAYATRRKNRVRMTDAVIQRVTVRRAAGRIFPVLLVKPTGSESGFARRKTRRAVWVAAEHVRLIATAEEIAY